MLPTLPIEVTVPSRKFKHAFSFVIKLIHTTQYIFIMTYLLREISTHFGKKEGSGLLMVNEIVMSKLLSLAGL